MHETPEGVVAAYLTEVEAYQGEDDPASHAFRGPTPRSAIMFGPPGIAYVYQIYGMYQCLNVVCGPDGEASAVLVRAAVPCAGEALMAQRRGLRAQADPRRAAVALCGGPGKLAQAFGLHRTRHNGLDLTSGPLRLERGLSVPPEAVRRTPRIGIRVAAERPWRFVFDTFPGPS